jgi:hypothetical protein
LPADEHPAKRRIRYSGRYPKEFSEKYKELGGDAEVAEKVRRKGGTPAGQHVPIMVKEVLEHLGLLEGAISEDFSGGMPALQPTHRPLLAVDCTLGFGGHSLEMMQILHRRWDGSRFLGLDQDSLEIARAEARLTHARAYFPVVASASADDKSLSVTRPVQMKCVVANFGSLGYVSLGLNFDLINCIYIFDSLSIIARNTH